MFWQLHKFPRCNVAPRRSATIERTSEKVIYRISDSGDPHCPSQPHLNILKLLERLQLEANHQGWLTIDNDWDLSWNNMNDMNTMNKQYPLAVANFMGQLWTPESGLSHQQDPCRGCACECSVVREIKNQIGAVTIVALVLLGFYTHQDPNGIWQKGG